jgi:hypothetical protein
MKSHLVLAVSKAYTSMMISYARSIISSSLQAALTIIV